MLTSTSGDRPLTTAQVAARMGKTLAWWRRNGRRLQREHGFPAPIPGFGHVWDPLAIDEWLARQRGEAQAVAHDGRAEPDWGAILDGRADHIMAPTRHWTVS